MQYQIYFSSLDPSYLRDYRHHAEPGYRIDPNIIGEFASLNDAIHFAQDAAGRIHALSEPARPRIATILLVDAMDNEHVLISDGSAMTRYVLLLPSILDCLQNDRNLLRAFLLHKFDTHTSDELIDRFYGPLNAVLGEAETRLINDNPAFKLRVFKMIQDGFEQAKEREATQKAYDQEINDKKEATDETSGRDD